jgi:adenine-specific DNA-methyltransferase
MRKSFLVPGSNRIHEVHCGDATEIAADSDCSVVYADPPYTKRQYAAYYHVLETLTLDDDPPLVGSTGLRPWQTKSSPFCYRSKAPQALAKLVDSLRCKHFFLSYNSDGQIPHATILDILGVRGRVKVFEAAYRRYKSSSLPHKGSHLIERLYHLSIV